MNASGLEHPLIGLISELRFSARRLVVGSDVELLLNFKPQRPYAALRDDVATTAHYMGMDQPIPVPEVIDPPKAKPALAGLSVIASEGRYQGLGFTDA
jgi:hypothetical protein